MFTKSGTFLSINNKVNNGAIPDPMLWVWTHPYFREETLCAIWCGCGHTHAWQRDPYMPYVACVGHPYLFKKHAIFLCNVHQGCGYAQAILQLLREKRMGVGTPHKLRAGLCTETSIWRRRVCGHPRGSPCEFQGDIWCTLKQSPSDSGSTAIGVGSLSPQHPGTRVPNSKYLSGNKLALNKANK